jgi:hypothetical protein
VEVSAFFLNCKGLLYKKKNLIEDPLIEKKLTETKRKKEEL